jgi:hypothetical protein
LQAIEIQQAQTIALSLAGVIFNETRNLPDTPRHV